MGYDLHITRAIDWRDNQGNPIPAAEWLDLRRTDPELVPDAAYGPYAARYRNDGWIDWYDGNLFTTDPPRATVAKMLEVAGLLKAIVQGDDGEIYENALQWPRRFPRGSAPGS